MHIIVVVDRGVSGRAVEFEIQGSVVGDGGIAGCAVAGEIQKANESVGDGGAAADDADAIESEGLIVGEGVGRGPGVECPAAEHGVGRERQRSGVRRAEERGAVGTVAGVQLAAVLKLPDVGLRSQVASRA